MASEGNADQIAYWNGKAGEKWAREQNALDQMLAPVAARLLDGAGIAQGSRVLDVGCGCGTVTLEASSTTGPTGFVVGVDISAPMIQRAREQSSGRGNVQFVLADASAEPFDASFDVVLSRFGIMFFADPTSAFRNLKTALKKGGRLVFVCWRAIGENQWASVPRDAVLTVVPPPEPSKPNAPGPFALADRARLETILSDAGFSDIEVAPFDTDLVISETGLEGAVDFAANLGPAGALLREATDETKRAARDAIRPLLAPFVKPEGRVAMHGAMWLVRAKR